MLNQIHLFLEPEEGEITCSSAGEESDNEDKVAGHFLEHLGKYHELNLVQVLFLVAAQINSCSQYMWATDSDENPIQVLEFSVLPNSDFPFLRTFRELTQHAS